MTDTANLGLPCIEGSQAQKHVTHNDALRILDTLVQLAVLDRDLAAPPGSPAEGQRWIVKTGATGAWTGHVNTIAAWQDGGWQFSTPQSGWCAFVVDEGALLLWNGTAWDDFFSTVTSIQNLALLGVGTTADSTNRLSAKLNNTLFAAKTVAEGGDGNLRYKLSKESSSKTLSFLLQDNYSGRAEIGLTGDDDFHFKVSPDGSTWYEGIKIAAATGKVSFPVTGGPREVLSANRTYYVRTDGNDSNDGLTNSSGGAFLTIQKAINVVAALDISIYNVTIQVGAGTYSAGATVSAPWVGKGSVTLLGDATTPSNVVLSTSGAAVSVSIGRLSISGLKITTTNHGIYVEKYGVLNIVGKMEFGSVTYDHLSVNYGGAIFITTDYTISGGSTNHWSVTGTASQIWAQSRTITLTGTPAFSGKFAYASTLSNIICNGNTFSGSATGVRYGADTNAAIQTYGGGATYLPGGSAGSTASGGQYA